MKKLLKITLKYINKVLRNTFFCTLFVFISIFSSFIIIFVGVGSLGNVFNYIAKKIK